MRFFNVAVCACLGVSLLSLTAAADEPALQAGKFITLDVVVADMAGGGPAVPTAAVVLEMEKVGKLSGVARYRMTALENQATSLQFGERVPLVSGRVERQGGFGGGGATYSQMNVGTLISSTSRVEDDGAIVAMLKFERSGVSPPQPRAADAPEANVAAPQGTTTVSFQTTVRVKPGEPLLAGGRQTGMGADATQTWIVLTATVAAGAPVDKVKPAAVLEAEDQLKIVALKHAAATALASVLQETFAREAVRIGVDARTNSLLLRGSPARLEVVLAVIMRLDAE